MGTSRSNEQANSRCLPLGPRVGKKLPRDELIFLRLYNKRSIMLYLAQGQVKKYPLLYLAFWPKNQGGFQEEYYFIFCLFVVCRHVIILLKASKA